MSQARHPDLKGPSHYPASMSKTNSTLVLHHRVQVALDQSRSIQWLAPARECSNQSMTSGVIHPVGTPAKFSSSIATSSMSDNGANNQQQQQQRSTPTIKQRSSKPSTQSSTTSRTMTKESPINQPVSSPPLSTFDSTLAAQCPK